MKWVIKRLAFPRSVAGKSQQANGRPARSEVTQHPVVLTSCVVRAREISDRQTVLMRLAWTSFTADFLGSQPDFTESAGPKRVGHLGNSTAFTRSVAQAVAIICQTPY